MELSVQYLIPEIIILATACLATLVGLSTCDKTRRFAQVLSLLGLAVAGAFAFTANYPADAFPSAVHFNPNYITCLTCVIGFLSVLAAWDMPAKADPGVSDSHYRGEFFGMLLFSLAGVAMIGKVNDLVWLFVALELVSIPTYILVATGRAQIIAQEAGVKYFFLGELAAAIFGFGFSYLYGATGSTRFVDIHAFLSTHPMTPLALIGFLMVILGIGFKLAAVPFHFYTPDVYQGAATPVTAFLAFAPKAAGLVSVISVLSLFDFNYTTTYGSAIMTVLTVMAVLTMTIGNVLALLQRNVKRIFAYSSIAHSGYMLVGLVAGVSISASADGVDASLFYLTSYAIMNLGAFSVLIYLQGKADAGEDLDDLAGIAKEHPLAALMFALCLFSLIGMPLTIGFLGKLYIVQSALASGHVHLAVIVMINAAIAAAYYLKIIAAMYLRDPLYPFAVRKPVAIKLAAGLCTLAVVLFFFAPSPLMHANSHTALIAPQPKVLTIDAAASAR